MFFMSCQPQKTVLVTGAARRIGAVIAETLARAGWAVLIHANRSAAAARQLAERLRGQGFAADAVAGDFSAADGPERVFARAAERAGNGLAAIVNNASIFGRAEPAAFLRVNYEAPVILTRLLAKHLAGRGCVVNLLDQRIADAADRTPYTESKRRLADFTVGQARAFAPALRLNGVAPGAVLLPAEKASREPAGDFPLGFRPTPEQVAAAVRFLLEADAVTGQIIYADAGQHCNSPSGRAEGIPEFPGKE